MWKPQWEKSPESADSYSDSIDDVDLDFWLVHGTCSWLILIINFLTNAIPMFYPTNSLDLCMTDGLFVNLLLGLQKDDFINSPSQLFGLIHENSKGII